MPIYEFQSPCGEFLSTAREMSADTLSKTCPCCGLEARRIFSTFGFHREIPGMYNPSVGSYVANQREFRDKLKKASDEQSERTGVTHNYVPFDTREVKAPQVEP